MEVVIIGCKIPNGVWLQVEGDKRIVTINGSNSALVYGGHGLTYDVPKDLWQRYSERFAEHDMIKNELLFPHTEEKSIKAMAKERRTNKSKMEQVKPLEQTDQPDAIGALDVDK